MKEYREIRVQKISDIRIGDIVIYGNKAFGFVFGKGRTILHQHNFIRVRTAYSDTYRTYKEKWYDSDIDYNDVVLRSIHRINHDALVSGDEQHE